MSDHEPCDICDHMEHDPERPTICSRHREQARQIFQWFNTLSDDKQQEFADTVEDIADHPEYPQ